MSCIVPATTSPGKLALVYHQISTNIRHQISWNFIAGVDLTSVSFLRTEAERIAGFMGAALTDDFTITDWAILTPSGGSFYEEPLASAVDGTHTTASFMQEWASPTICLQGTATPPAPGYCHGHVISRLFCGNTYYFPPQSKFYDGSADAGLGNFIGHGLNESTYVPADRYGQQANIQTLCPVQFNAFIQRTEGT